MFARYGGSTGFIFYFVSNCGLISLQIRSFTRSINLVEGCLEANSAREVVESVRVKDIELVMLFNFDRNFRQALRKIFLLNSQEVIHLGSVEIYACRNLLHFQWYIYLDSRWTTSFLYFPSLIFVVFFWRQYDIDHHYHLPLWYITWWQFFRNLPHGKYRESQVRILPFLIQPQFQVKTFLGSLLCCPYLKNLLGWLKITFYI